MFATIASLICLFDNSSGSAQAIELCSTRGWEEHQYNVGEYVWVNSSSFIYWTHEHRPVPISPTAYQFEDIHTWNLYDIKTHKTINFTKQNGMKNDSMEASVSPDGARLLWCGYRDHNPFWFMSKLDGTDLHVWPRHAVPGVISNPDPCSYAFWSSDSKSIIESQNMEDSTTPHLKVWIRSVNAPEDESPPRPISNPDWAWFAVPIASDRLIGFGGLMANEGNDVSLWNKDTKGKPIRYHVQTPEEFVNLWSCGVSPDGNYLLWGLERSFDHNKDGGYAIATSRLGSTKMKICFEIPTRPIITGVQPKCFGGVKWMPDGKHVSFIFGQRLYEIEVKR